MFIVQRSVGLYTLLHYSDSVISMSVLLSYDFAYLWVTWTEKKTQRRERQSWTLVLFCGIFSFFRKLQLKFCLCVVRVFEELTDMSNIYLVQRVLPLYDTAAPWKMTLLREEQKNIMTKHISSSLLYIFSFNDRNGSDNDNWNCLSGASWLWIKFSKI